MPPGWNVNGQGQTKGGTMYKKHSQDGHTKNKIKNACNYFQNMYGFFENFGEPYLKPHKIS